MIYNDRKVSLEMKYSLKASRAEAQEQAINI